MRQKTSTLDWFSCNGFDRSTHDNSSMKAHILSDVGLQYVDHRCRWVDRSRWLGCEYI